MEKLGGTCFYLWGIDWLLKSSHCITFGKKVRSHHYEILTSKSVHVLVEFINTCKLWIFWELHITILALIVLPWKCIIAFQVRGHDVTVWMQHKVYQWILYNKISNVFTLLFQTSSAIFFNCSIFDLQEKPLTVGDNQLRMRDRRREDSPWRDRFNSSFSSTLTVSVVLFWHGWPFRLPRCACTDPCQAEKATPCLRNQAATLPTHHRLHAHNKKKLHNLFTLLH